MEVIANSLCYENDSVNPAPHKDSLVRKKYLGTAQIKKAAEAACGSMYLDEFLDAVSYDKDARSCA